MKTEYGVARTYLDLPVEGQLTDVCRRTLQQEDVSVMVREG